MSAVTPSASTVTETVIGTSRLPGQWTSAATAAASPGSSVGFETFEIATLSSSPLVATVTFVTDASLGSRFVTVTRSTRSLPVTWTVSES